MEKFDQKIKNKISSLDYNQAPGTDLMFAMFDQLEKSQIQDTPVVELLPKKETKYSYRFYFRIAAAMVILVAVGFSLYRVNDVSLYALKGRKLTHQLPDGSDVALNADSKIEYNKISWWFSRNVSLEGEAFFDVEKGEKFIVSSRLGSTQVLGTSFNIYSRNQDYKVECISGRVEVKYIGGIDKTILTPGKGVQFSDSKEGELFSFSNEKRVDWRSGEFHFDNESLINVLAALSRQYNIEIRLDKKYDQNNYTGYFNDKNLGTALKLICDPFELNYQIKDGYVVIE